MAQSPDRRRPHHRQPRQRRCRHRQTHHRQQKRALGALPGSPQRPKIISSIVDDIDSIVKATRLPGWQTTSRVEIEIKQVLRKTLFKYKLHKDNELFDKAYAYISEHY